MVTDAAPILQLMQIKGVGSRALSRLLDSLDSAGLTLDDFVALPQADLIARFGLNQDQARSLRESEATMQQLAEKLDHKGVEVVLRDTPGYPERIHAVLKEKAPPVLFLAGSRKLLNMRGVGFCGARDASAEALRCADQVARALARHELLVVSGNAHGVDETAHHGALAHGGRTALVAPEGILRFRPRSHFANLLTEDNYVIVSEFPPNLPWSVANAMQRNRTICGLVHALIVIEAGTSGGTWEAGLAALDLGLPLFVLDYSNPSPSGLGNPLLLQRGGQPLPCRPGEPADLTLLLKALDLPLTLSKETQPTLFDHIPHTAAPPPRRASR